MTHTLAHGLQDIGVRAQLEASASERISNTRDIALHTLAFYLSLIHI